MKKKIPKRDFFYVGMIIVIIIFSVITIIHFEKENLLLKTILIADNDYIDNSLNKKMAESYYEKAILSYEIYLFEDAEYNCELARNYYFDSVQGYRTIKAELNDKKIEHRLIELYILQIEESIKIDNNMFEACEYLESASRAYNNDYYESGDLEIEMMGEKINAHDDAVRRYNDYLAEYNIELKKI